MPVETRSCNRQPLEDSTPADMAAELTDGFAGRLISKKAKQLSRRQEFCREDRGDLEQELRLALLAGLKSFRWKRRHWNVFATTVIERKVASLVEQARASKRDGQADVSSLSETVTTPEGEEEEVAGLISPEDQARVRDLAVRGHVDQVDLERDVEQLIITRIPRSLRPLARLLKRYDVPDLAKKLGVKERTLRNRISRMRQRVMEQSQKKRGRNPEKTGR